MLAENLLFLLPPLATRFPVTRTPESVKLTTALKKLMPSGSIGPVYLKPFPLQWNRRQESLYRQVFTGEDPAGSEREFTEGQLEKLKRDTYKLVEHYRKCGFDEVPGSGEDKPYFVRSAVPTSDAEMYSTIGKRSGAAQ